MAEIEHEFPPNEIWWKESYRPDLCWRDILLTYWDEHGEFAVSLRVTDHQICDVEKAVRIRQEAMGQMDKWVTAHRAKHKLPRIELWNYQWVL